MAATGDDRVRQLGRAINDGDGLSVAFEAFRRSSASLAEEATLVASFDSHIKDAHAASAQALGPLLAAGTAGALPAGQIERYHAVRQDLAALRELYQRAESEQLTRAVQDERGLASTAVAWSGVQVIVIVATALRLRRTARRRSDKRDRVDTASARIVFEAELQRALELATDARSAFAVADKVLADVVPSGGAISVADTSGTRLVAVSTAPRCGVATPEDCPVCRTGAEAHTEDSSQVGTCPVLAAAVLGEPVAATCTPVTIKGRVAAVVQVVTNTEEDLDQHRAAALVTRPLTERVGVLEALATFELQAARDPLTGLLNRRSLETKVERLDATQTGYAVVFCDLDHFKLLNDISGHDAGDRALRGFANTLATTIRPQDIACRWGGEEFVIVLPACDAMQAAAVMERLRAAVAGRSNGGGVAAVTASFGVADSTMITGFGEVVDLADAALRAAKEAGRDRVVVSGAA